MGSNRVRRDHTEAAAEQLHTVTEACRMLHISLATFNRAVAKGEIHVVRPTGPRGDRRVRSSELARLTVRNRWSRDGAGEVAA